MRNEKIPSPNAQQQRKNGSSKQSPPISVKPNTVAFLCDSIGKFLNMRKLFHTKQELKYFRYPTNEDGRDTLQTNLQEHPKLLVIHTGTNNLTPTSQIDEFVSEISAFVTQVSTKFPKSKIIYSTLLHHKFSNQLPVALSQTGSFLLDLTTEKTHLMLSRTLTVVAIILHSNHSRTNHHPGHHRF